ncbi:type II toxin-antitoxin system VapC family toxin [Rhizobium sp. LjRoot254]|uniref:type II toxin-antitoxin system VapC family toxin n=1 Tax=Rhizobium sp. LjRoot254 TaxID=3342297 RepID=UPI003ECDCAB1
MSGFLLDTNVVSKFAPGRPDVPAELQDWMRSQGALGRLFISSMTVAEISSGLRRLQRKGATAKAAALSAWLDGIISTFEDQILAMDLNVALLVGQMEDEVIAKGFDPGLADIIIAATAKAHGLTVVTENIRHFAPFDTACEQPLGSHPLK